MHGQWYPRQQQPPPQRVRWVATPPPGAMPLRYPRRRRPYSGPPSYPAPPRWGFPQLSWRWPTTVPGVRVPADAESVRSAGKLSWLMVSVTGVTALLAFVGELLRYTLLVAGLSGPVSPGLLTFSDTLVIAAGLVTVIFALTSLVLALRWVHFARAMSAQRTGRRPAHSDTRALLSMVIPGWNLVGPLTVLTELEHVISENAEPRPSKALWTWWGCWLLNAVLFTLTVIWGFRDSVQAMADGVLLHAITDVAAAVLAWQTARMISALTILLAGNGDEGLRYRRLVSAEDLPVTETRAPRAATATR